MKVISKAGKEELATVYIAETEDGRRVEFVESLEVPIPRERKWVLIISTLFGCPAGCLICDAGRHYSGRLSAEQLLFQVDYPVKKRYPDLSVPAGKFKIQFARMGEPALNRSVLDVLEILPGRYHAPGLLPAISTIAPAGRESFFEELFVIKERHYRGRFQLQFSVHSTDEEARDRLMPPKKWKLEGLARYGELFHREGDRKITLNFALAPGYEFDPGVLIDLFDPSKFLIKVTPVNPTRKAAENGFKSLISGNVTECRALEQLRSSGFDLIISIGQFEENAIGSNCGQYIESEGESPGDSYSYAVDPA